MPARGQLAPDELRRTRQLERALRVRGRLPPASVGVIQQQPQSGTRVPRDREGHVGPRDRRTVGVHHETSDSARRRHQQHALTDVAERAPGGQQSGEAPVVGDGDAHLAVEREAEVAGVVGGGAGRFGWVQGARVAQRRRQRQPRDRLPVEAEGATGERVRCGRPWCRRRIIGRGGDNGPRRLGVHGRIVSGGGQGRRVGECRGLGRWCRLGRGVPPPKGEGGGRRRGGDGREFEQSGSRHR
ncbi:MAG: hypothetical protein AAF628_18560 [Planctomycetota bacterium]